MTPYKTHTIPAQEWEQNWQPPTTIKTFGTLGSIPQATPKIKLRDRERPVRSRYNLPNSIFNVLHMDTGRFGKPRLAYFRPHHPQLDRPILSASEFKTYHIQNIPHKIDEYTQPPQSTAVARKFPYAHQWEQEHNQETEQLESQQSITWIPYEKIQPTVSQLY